MTYYDDCWDDPNYCGSCKYYWASKEFCRLKKTTVFPNSLSCSQRWDPLKPRPAASSSKKSSCFLTSACCEYMGLADNCYELETLRKFRDEQLCKIDNGTEIKEVYYRDAPGIVDAINASQQKDELYKYIYDNVLRIVEMIENKEYERATNNYLFMVYKLSADLK